MEHEENQIKKVQDEFVYGKHRHDEQLSDQSQLILTFYTCDPDYEL
jgi:hypothetical protein